MTVPFKPTPISKLPQNFPPGQARVSLLEPSSQSQGPHNSQKLPAKHNQLPSAHLQPTFFSVFLAPTAQWPGSPAHVQKGYGYMQIKINMQIDMITDIICHTNKNWKSVINTKQSMYICVHELNLKPLLPFSLASKGAHSLFHKFYSINMHYVNCQIILWEKLYHIV